jgi:hypothetical protein
MEYLMMKHLPEVHSILGRLGSAKAIIYLSKLSNLPMGENLTTKEVVCVLNIVKSNPLSSLEGRIEELKKVFEYFVLK